ncbi:MAG: hypothetical protein ACYC3X_18845 [Pirellulaceae bacterium]
MTNITSAPRTNKTPAFYVPVNMDPKMIPRGQRQLAAYVLNLVHWKTACWQADRHGYVHLMNKFLTKIIPQAEWSPLRERLEGLGVLEIDSHYMKGLQAMGYRIPAEYRATRRVICSDPQLAERIAQAYRFESIPWLPVHKQLAAALNRLTMDMEHAARVIPALMPDDSKMDPAEYQRITWQQCERIADQDHHPVVCKYGRFHSMVTRLAKKLRPCLKLDGQPLVGVDLANSQPLILGIVARQYWSDKKVAHRLRERRYASNANPYNGRALRRVEATTEDLKCYLDICQAGQLYESLMQPGDDRDAVKTALLTALYGKNHWHGKLQDHYEQTYPSVARMLREIKRKNHARAAHLMQNAESSLFIGTIAANLLKHNPALPLVTIHDGLYTTDEYLDTVRQAVLDEFRKINIQPTLHEEHYR